MNLKKYQLWTLPVISGIMLSCGWLGGIFQLLIFFAFIPLLVLEDYYFQQIGKRSSFRIFFKSLLGFLIWNAISSYWIWNASESGAIMAIVFNSIFMATLFWIFHATKKKLGRRLGYIAFVAYWVGFEYLHLNWELSWTWLTLGNGLSENIRLIQWYEYTGTLGGSLWILVCNLMFFEIFRNLPFRNKKLRNVKITYAALALFLPIVISFIIYTIYKEKGKPVEVVVVQPNIDPYNDKFGGMPVELQLEKIIHLADSLCDENTDYVVAPETAIPLGIWEEDLQSHPDIISLKVFTYRHPRVKIVIGASTFKMFKGNEKLSPTAHLFSDSGEYYDSYNTALQIDTGKEIQIYHKSKLVLGVEKMPFLNSIDWLKDVSIELGGTSGSLGTQPEPGIFISGNREYKIAPVICYESIYGEYVTGYIQKGANLIFVITNDGWWGNTPGYTQHLSYSSLRAIETRRDIARSANTGISCFVNQLGEIQQPTKWWTPTAIKQKILTNNETTFYVRMGDYIGRIAGLLSVLIFLFFITMMFRKKKV